MKLCIAIFEDDLELNELLQELLTTHGYKPLSYLSLKQVDWDHIDLILADYRNSVVSFDSVVKSASIYKIPVIAISGGTMNYPLQLEKPFLIEDLEKMIFKILGSNFKAKSLQNPNVKKDQVSKEGFFSKIFGNNKKVS